MKKLILALLLTFSTSVFADGCDSLHGLAGTISDARMGGMSQEKALQIAENSELSEMAVFLVNWAYSLDLMGSESDRNIEIQTFQAQVYIMCKEYTK